ncbi:MAG: translational GTPase TypA [Proteobacteria bacterium]|jgi:GTP-binding protein|nr:translational GTPase TypA [Desulfocapsa sp.]MBU3945657.1 translational GTPase TypA [Pseudomonadota bacterium]MCG2743632.1 translational GTPase TypA [Desulfobacteraceae bacterium]MDO8948228.1 translational GTPase TypA [Desulfocapsaceae bacterium]MBU4030263.1 translational GTPase TypA [Pseudomonadota bacterium]
MKQEKIRNVAIIAHVDHGKTTLVDQLFKYSGMFRDNQDVAERLMDSGDLERERGITITAKNGSYQYEDFSINIIDTPGHADFGGQVERVLRMADGALLLVDAQEGPMPQTYFVLKKALENKLPVIVVINKIDKPAARCPWVLDQVFDLFVKLDAPDDVLDFPVVYASAKDGYAMADPDDPIEGGMGMQIISKMITEHIPAPTGSPDAPLQLQISTIDYSQYLGRLGIGKVLNGTISINQPLAVARRDGSIKPVRISKIYRFESDGKVPIDSAGVGEIIAVAGMDDVTVGVTFTDPDNPMPLPLVAIDPPTISMNFIPNDSPFAGKEGKFVTSRHIEERLAREVLSDVALHYEPLTDAVGYRVSGRGELHLSILIEKMRREDYELQVTRPQVIMKEENGKIMEPFESLTIDVDEKYQGAVIEKLGRLKGQMEEMSTGHGGMMRMVFKIPTRGLLGYRSEFMTDTKGMGMMSYVFAEYGPYAGEIKNRLNGVLLVKEPCTAVAYALFNLQERGTLFIHPGAPLYTGQIIGESSRGGDMVVNPGKGKKLTNMRASGSDEAVILTPPRALTLEDCIAYINDDELVEVTPKSIRLRKKSDVRIRG